MAEQIVRTVLAEAAQRGATAVRSVDVEVGALEGVPEAGLREAFALAAKDTLLERAELRVAVGQLRGLVIRRASLVLPDRP
jgi:Zn finger protein HypA/HybF involved in hydrogenase expression